MKKEDVIVLIKNNLLEIMPELEEQEINIDESLVNIGVGSIDRAEMIMMTMEDLDINLPRVKFATAITIAEYADILHRHVST